MTRRTSSPLLINEEPLQFLPSLAVIIAREARRLYEAGQFKEGGVIGDREALALQQVHYWLGKPKMGVTVGGVKYIFNSYPKWRETFPCWSSKTIERIFTRLEALGLLTSIQLDSRDRSKHYTINYDQLNTLMDAYPDEDEEDQRGGHDGAGSDNVMPIIRPPQVDAKHSPKLAGSTPPSWRDGPAQVGAMEDDNLGATSPQVGGVLNKVSENTQRIHTHTGSSVCDRTDFTWDDYLAFAKSQQSIAKPEAWAHSHFDKRDRDRWVCEYQQTKEPPPPKPGPERLGRQQAAQLIASIRDAGGDVAAEIDSLHVSPEVRDYLRETFLKTVGAAGD